MRVATALSCLAFAPIVCVAQTPGWHPELAVAYGWYSGVHEPVKNNLLDKDRNDALALSVSYFKCDSSQKSSFSWGGSFGTVLWESTPLLTLTFGGSLWLRSIFPQLPRTYIRGDVGWLIGAWLHTESGQLSGSTTMTAIIGLPIWKSVFLELGAMGLSAKGPYALYVDGQWEEEDDAFFTYAITGLRMSF